MKKSILAIILILALSLTTLAGCGGNTTGGNSTTNLSASTAGNSTADSNDTGKAWPAEWPSAIPTLDGTVQYVSSNRDLATEAGITVTVGTTSDAVSSYIDSLVAKGYTKTVDLPGNDRMAEFDNGTYWVHVQYNASKNNCDISVRNSGIS